MRLIIGSYGRGLIQSTGGMQPELSQSKGLLMRFNVNIRREARRKIIRNHRNQELFDCPPAEEIRRQWSLPPSLEKVTVCCIITYRSEELLQLPLKSHMEAEEEYSMRPLDDHISFWSFFLQQVFLSLEPFTSEMVNFLHEFVGKYKYRQLVPCRPLQCKVINVLELSAHSAHSSKQYREKLLKWVGGPEGINVIYQCLFHSFLPCDEFPSVYQVLINTLKIKRRAETDTCCLIIDEMLRSADADDVYNIYEHFHDLTLKLMEEGLHYVDQEGIDNIADAIMLLIDSYNQVKVDFMRDGLAYLCARMVTSRLESNVLKGLEMIGWITEIQSKQLMEYLVTDREVCEVGLWKGILESGELLNHRNLTIRKSAFKLLNNVIVGGEYEQLVFLTSNFSPPFADDFIHFLQLGLQNESDEQIIGHVLSMLVVVLYYGEQYPTEDGMNLPLQMCRGLGLERELERACEHQNFSIRERAEEALNAFHREEPEESSFF